MSVSPAQNFLKPSPVPGPSTVYLKSGFVAANASATPVEMGSTVDEPETKISPETLPPAAGSRPAPPWRRRGGGGRRGGCCTAAAGGDEDSGREGEGADALA